MVRSGDLRAAGEKLSAYAGSSLTTPPFGWGRTPTLR
jgi:hypothetical protein